jgi:dimethylargininase
LSSLSASFDLLSLGLYEFLLRFGYHTAADLAPEGVSGLGFFDYSQAIVRTPDHSVVDGLRRGNGPAPDYKALVEEHQDYVAVLRALGLAVEELPPADNFPDSIFVEDPALVFAEGAILLNQAAPSRAGEAGLLAPALEARFEQVLRMTGPGHVDGGDILTLPDKVLIGLSRRTDSQGAAELIGLLAQLGLTGEVAQTPPGVLHFKTGCSLIDEETLFALPEMAGSPAFAGLRVISVPEGEAKAANKLRIRDTALIGEGFPRSRDIIESFSIPTIALKVEHIGRIDAGLSCMSLRWKNEA